MYHPLHVTDVMFENPEPFSLKQELIVPYTLQIIILTTAPLRKETLTQHSSFCLGNSNQTRIVRSKLHDGPLRRKTATSLVGQAEVRDKSSQLIRKLSRKDIASFVSSAL